jgi:hypothetical protein
MFSPYLISINTLQATTRNSILANSNYTENLSVYLTSAQALWKVNLSGGAVNVTSVTVPSSVGGYSLTLTSYGNWSSAYEIFTRYGFGLLGGSEPYQSGALLVVNGSSSSDAKALANSLGQRFALAFVQTGSSSSSFTFFSPINYVTELNLYFYSLVPQSEGGFASMFSSSQFQSNEVNYYQLSYSGSTYSLSLGGIAPAALSSNNFHLYSQLGLSGSSYNYSSSASSSSIDIHILGGLVSNASSPFANHVSNLSSSIEVTKSGNNTVPNIGASLDFSFPTILAYRQVTPSLTPATGSNVTVTITVANISPTTGGASATNVFVNDSWIDSESSSFHLTQTHTSNNQTLPPAQSYTVIYAFTVAATSGTFTLPATPVSYQYVSSNGTKATGQAFLNPETLVIGGSNAPELEATARLASGTQIQSGQPYSVNVTIVNKGSGAAFALNSSGLTKASLPSGGSWSYISNESSNSLTQTNAVLSYSVQWQDASGKTHNATTNAVSTILGFATPGSPALSITKNVGTPNSGLVNVTLVVFNNSPGSISSSTVNDTIPSGMTFSRSFNSTNISSSGTSVTANLSSIGGQSTKVFVYELSVGSGNDNYVFLPASVTTPWNGQEITHYSGGFGLPLGVTASKSFSPASGFQGSNVTISVGLSNRGSLPVYDVNVNNAVDPFVTRLSSNSSSASVLNAGSQINAQIKANLTGAPGVYNSSTSAATFIFAGANQTATSPIVTVSIYSLPSANLTYSALKLEEGHNIVVTITVFNPSDITITGVSYTMSLPSNLKLVGSGSPDFTIPSLGPNSSSSHSFTVITSQPYLYQFSNGKLTFQYQGHQLNGTSSSLKLNIGDDIKLRYGVPGLIGVILVLATLFYVRRLARPAATTKKPA